MQRIEDLTAAIKEDDLSDEDSSTESVNSDMETIDVLPLRTR